MKYVTALLLKFIMITAVLWIILGSFFNVGFGNILATSIILALASFLIGDMFILPQYENSVATMADFALAFIGIWVIGFFLYEQPISLRFAALVSALGLAVGEVFFHRYLDRRVIKTGSRPRKRELGDLQTEFASEMNIKRGTRQTTARRIDRRHYLDDR